MTEWIDVPVAEVKVGDGVNLDGIGAGAAAWCEFHGGCFYRVVRLHASSVEVDVDGHLVPVRVRRASIVSARRGKPEPEPKPGDWRCADWNPAKPTDYHLSHHVPACRVYRASSGWSKDTRTGQPWVLKENDQVDVVIRSRVGHIGLTLKAGLAGGIKPGESYVAYYKRIGLDVRPVERRKR